MVFRHVLAKLNQLFPVSVPSIFLGNGEVTHVRLPSHKRLLLQAGAAVTGRIELSRGVLHWARRVKYSPDARASTKALTGVNNHLAELVADGATTATQYFGNFLTKNSSSTLFLVSDTLPFFLCGAFLQPFRQRERLSSSFSSPTSRTLRVELKMSPLSDHGAYHTPTIHMFLEIPNANWKVPKYNYRRAPEWVQTG